MSKSKLLALLVVSVVSSFLLSGCYFADVESSQMGVETYRGGVTQILPPGGHQNFAPFYAIDIIDVSAKTLEWSDPDLVTKDKQPIGLSLAVTFARKRDIDSIELMWDKYRSEAVSDDALFRQVQNRVPAIAKTVTAKYTLDEQLGTEEGSSTGRGVVTQDLFDLLQPQLEEFGVELLDIRVSNISPDPQYLEILKEKARANVEREVAQQRTLQLQEQLKQEKAQTEIELEKARRQNQVNEELSRVYNVSDRYYELERLRLLEGVIGDNDKMYFIPQGTDLTLILSGQGGASAPFMPITPGAEETETETE